MLKAICERFRQGHRTMAFPAEVKTPLHFRGLPEFLADACPAGCNACVAVCPYAALTTTPAGPRLDLGRCTFCNLCVEACQPQALRFGADYRLATASREALQVGPGEPLQRAVALGEELRRLLGRSLKLRQVSAGGCNACEADTNVLNTIGWDLGRFGIQFVASPRHADGILVTGPVSQNMRAALLKTHGAVPAPKLVIACGACAIAGGPYAGQAEVVGGVGELLPVDLFIPGCPPHPATILDGLLRLLGRLAGL